ncbi:MAG: signal peptide peptidase SppA [Erythrobacter sp.]|uniref:signal peptide peptidase SppA n=1 Tax=Erythrobacter sp. TaxID=1042 RepID=UPI0026393125|nr:signal peptide peptidase SppA [Erythrobacter sp.]MDJ0978922.1 signal peptide peptidase SppA [Erythrobacter sp.]
MGFVGKFWKVLVGVKDGLVLLFMLLFFVTLFAALSASPSPAKVREGALYIDLTGFVVEERAPIDPWGALLSRSAPPTQHQARDVVRALDAAVGDDRIKAVVMDLTTFVGGGQVHMQEIAEAMDRVRKADKPVLTYALGYGDDHMHLASHASEVWLDPLGGATIRGPGGSFLFYAELLKKLNVNARVYRVGEFKAAVEPYVLNAMSPQARENIEGLYGALWEEWKANVAKGRPDLDLDGVTQNPLEWIEANDGDLAKASLAAGLVDTLGNRVEFGERVAELAGADEWDEKPGSYASTSLSAFLADHPSSTQGKAIAVVTVAGGIVDGNAGPGTAGGDRIARILDKALNSDVAGLVVRVDSPGGSVIASEEIRRAIDRYREKDLPVAVSFANVAASGGYWVATAGDHIFAQPETITGSIGVFAILPTFEGTASELGVNADAIRTTPLSGQPDIIDGLTPEVEGIFQASINDTYADFIERVSQARSIPGDEVDRIAQGRVWDGGTARQIKLVDQFGGLEDALAWVAGQAGLEDGGWHAKFLDEPEEGFDALIRQLLSNNVAKSETRQGGDMFALAAQSRNRTLARLLADAERLGGSHGVQAYCLECPAIERPLPEPVAKLSTLKALRALLAD